MAPLDREQRRQRIEDLQRYIAEQNAEFENEAFPVEVRDQWEAANRELDQLLDEQRELEARDRRLRSLSNSEGNLERGNYLGGGGRPSEGVAVISRMSEEQVYDLSSVRYNPFTGEGNAREMRERALRAVDLARLPRVPMYRDAKAHIEGLLGREDDDVQGSLIARRILLTGSPAYQRAFTNTLSAQLRGLPAAHLTGEEQAAFQRVSELQRAMAALTGSAGGFAVPYTLDPTIIPTSNLSVNPFRAICRVEQITVNEWRGVTSAGVTASYLAEATEASDNSAVLAQPNAIVQRASAFVPVSIELTMDWGALQSELANLIQDAKDDLEAAQFSTGSGTAPAPQGIITGSSSTVAAGGTASFAVTDLYNLETGLPPRFRPRAEMIANRFIYNLVRNFGTSGGASLWTPLPAPLQQGLESQVPRGGNTGYDLIGYPANESSGMVASIATGSKIMVMGDMRYYIIVDRIGLDIEVIPHLFGATSRFPTGQRGFFAYWRNTARVLDPNAFRVLVTS